MAYGRGDTTATQDDAAPIAAPTEVATSPAAIPAGVDRRGAAGPAAAGVPFATSGPGAVTREPADPPSSAAPPRRWRWAELLQRVFAVDVLACPNCGGRMRLIATIEDPRVVRRILTHLGLAGDEGPPAGLADP